VLHRHHLVHRDVTPGSLLLTSRPDGSLAVVVPDLGVARRGRRSGRRVRVVRGGVCAARRLESAPVVPVHAPRPPTTPSAGRSSVFYAAMTVLAVLVCTAYLGIVIVVSL